MKKKLKVGVIGIGHVAAIHLEAYRAHPEVEIAALCDTILEKAKRAALEFHVPSVYTDYRELLKQEDLDFIDICTPNAFHAIIATEGLHAGKHVFTEKPDAIDVEGALQMVEAARQSGKHLMAMRNNRFAPGVQFLKRFIDQGLLGEAYTGRCGWLRRRGIPGKGGWFTTREISGGGPLIDLGVHFIDVAIWLMGNPKPVSVVGATYAKFAETTLSDSIHSGYGEKQEDGTYDVEDLASGFIRFHNGETLQLEFSWASNVEQEESFVELRGTKAGFSLRKGEVKLYSEIANTMCITVPDLSKAKTGGNHAKHLHHFIDVLQERAEPIIRPEHGVDLIRILCALYESARTGREVRLDEERGNRLETEIRPSTAYVTERI
ncbi:Gfo/Idh/MocA family oxidoreductase [Bacillus sp. 3255]|uniref:Gfo/Idh/MocA family protein n=1 Tax=Bacillus sp. 3255 TaxID=2817904 RepID=UPI00285804F8|nr:Gfo/Idh/MocA family oxidoreductase [Bacillus sp. 3255]MDR6879516.1 putative dehydrogenase [Bacillus sp. 3255]